MKKKKSIAILIVLAFLLIIAGVIFSLRAFNSSKKNDGIKKYTVTKNTEYQQALITNIEGKIADGYQINEGNSRVDANEFLNSDIGEEEIYSDCNGEVNFVKENSNLTYNLNTSCSSDKGDIELKHTVTSISELNLSNINMIGVEDSKEYYILANTDENASEEDYKANAAVYKFDANNNIVFGTKIYDETINNVNSSSYINLTGIYESDDAYYVLGNVQNATGGLFTTMIEELRNIYQNNNMDVTEMIFSFIFKYDKEGNLISQNLINPLEGDYIVNSILGIVDNELYLVSNSKIIKYNISTNTLNYQKLDVSTLDKSILMDNSIYGYTYKCNVASGDMKNSKDSLIKLDLDGKKNWQVEMNNTKKIKENYCSTIFQDIYNVDNDILLITNDYKDIGIYNKDGKKEKEVSYADLAKNEYFSIRSISKTEEEIVVISSDLEKMIIDSYDSNYKLKSRQSLALEKITSVSDAVIPLDEIINNNKDGFSQAYILGEDMRRIVRVDYQYK